MDLCRQREKREKREKREERLRWCEKKGVVVVVQGDTVAGAHMERGRKEGAGALPWLGKKQIQGLYRVMNSVEVRRML